MACLNCRALFSANCKVAKLCREEEANVKSVSCRFQSILRRQALLLQHCAAGARGLSSTFCTFCAETEAHCRHCSTLCRDCCSNLSEETVPHFVCRDFTGQLGVIGRAVSTSSFQWHFSSRWVWAAGSFEESVSLSLSGSFEQSCHLALCKTALLGWVSNSNPLPSVCLILTTVCTLISVSQNVIFCY